MTTRIRLVAEFTIADGKTEEFRKLAAEAIEITQAYDQGALGYEFFFNKDGTKCRAIEQYKDSAATLVHFGIVSEVFASMMEIAQMTQGELYGEPSPELVEACAMFGTKVYRYWSGFVCDGS